MSTGTGCGGSPSGRYSDAAVPEFAGEGAAVLLKAMQLRADALPVLFCELHFAENGTHFFRNCSPETSVQNAEKGLPSPEVQYRWGRPANAARHCQTSCAVLHNFCAGTQGPCTQRYILQSMSEGIRQSPRGDKETVPTLGPSGRQLRLNCWAKKRLKKVSRVFATISSSPGKAMLARA